MPSEPRTPVVFSRDEVHEIRAALGAGAKARCPQCSSALVVDGPIAGDRTEGHTWYVRCDTCHRAAFITVPGGR